MVHLTFTPGGSSYTANFVSTLGGSKYTVNLAFTPGGSEYTVQNVACHLNNALSDWKP